MPFLSQEVKDFVSACEKIQARLSEGRLLTADEKGVLEMSALELLANLRQT